MSVYIIGCGGVGSWLVPALTKLIDIENLWLIDGDRLESKNLDRQLFNNTDIGKYKAEALGRKYGLKYMNVFYGLGTLEHSPTDWLLCACDNHPARVSVLRACDMFGCVAIIGANETNSAEAYYYHEEWKGTPCDPRVMYPEMVIDLSGDPMRTEGCTGEAQRQNRQLASANFMAAALMQHLLVLWKIEVLKLDAPIIPALPHQLSATLSRIGCKLVGDTLKGQHE
jgi:ThiF family